MDNFSQESEEGFGNVAADVISQSSDNGDIQFEEMIDLEQIQKEFKKKLHGDDAEPDSPFSANADDIFAEDKSETGFNAPNVLPAKLEIDPNAKKYVIYIDPANIDFMENLSIKERKDIINKILKEQNELSIKQRQFIENRKFFMHAILASFTFIIGFPIVFFIVNQSINATMVNYQQAKQNFSKLYKEQGKIKPSDSDAAKNFKY